jgi:hypothetical protein
MHGHMNIKFSLRYERNLKHYHLEKYSNNPQDIYHILRYLFAVHAAGVVHETGIERHPIKVWVNSWRMWNLLNI